MTAFASIGRSMQARGVEIPSLGTLAYLLYWPLFGIVFYMLERVWIRDYYHPMYCTLDDAIPFCELFLIPYLLWFVFMTGMLLYTLFRDVDAFKRMMVFIIVSYSFALLVFALYPNCQELRPESFPRNNVLTQFIEAFYVFDTSTNVCPSLHVLGSTAALFCAWDTVRFGTPGWKIGFGILAFLISISTVFLKQHSIVDVLIAIPICLIAWKLAYGNARRYASSEGRHRGGRLEAGALTWGMHR